MSKELDEKWRELVAAGKAEWMPGMRAIDSAGQAARVVQATGAAVLEDVGGAAYPTRSTPPDWSDPATLGCLFQMAVAAVVRADSGWHEVRDPPGLTPSCRTDSAWEVLADAGYELGVGGYAAEVASYLLAALEDAP